MIYCKKCMQPIRNGHVQLVPLPVVGEYCAYCEDCINKISLGEKQ